MLGTDQLNISPVLPVEFWLRCASITSRPDRESAMRDQKTGCQAICPDGHNNGGCDLDHHGDRRTPNLGPR